MANWINFHTHCNFCDGDEEPEKFVKKAIKEGMAGLGFSSHAPVSFETEWTMRKENLKDYINTIDILKKKYQDKLSIYTGLEIDYVLGLGKICDIDFSKIDYAIGSVHFLGSDGFKGDWSIDYNNDEFAKGIQRDFQGNVRKAVEVYYYTIQDMALKGEIDIVGHFDIIKMNNKDDRYFCEDESWYISLVEDTLKVVSKYGLIIEVNNGGITRGKTDSLYPSNWILERCCKKNIPITISSDAHRPEYIAYGFDKTAKVLKDIGFKEIYVLEHSQWKPKEFSTNGIK